MKKVIEVNKISKSYNIGKLNNETLRSSIVNLFSIKKRNETFLALDNISFNVNQGDVLGIIGKNGAGKSTLLKILSRITKPSKGQVKLEGRVASLLEVGTGFHPELTGRENIYLNGTLLGMSRKEINQKFDQIVDFSGVEKFLDTTVKHYSSGMYVRLAFSVAAYLEPEILIIDEVLAVGDSEFQNKCLGKMKNVAESGRTVIFVSHNLAAVKTLCNKAILLKNGVKIYEGSQKEAIDKYINNNATPTSYDHQITNTQYNNEYIKILQFGVSDKINDEIYISSTLMFSMVFENKHQNFNLDLTIEIESNDGFIIIHHGTIVETKSDIKKGIYEVTGEIKNLNLNAGKYYMNVIFGKDQRTRLLKVLRIIEFQVHNEAFLNNFEVLPGIIRPNILYKKKI